MSLSVDAYARQLKQLLPRGRLWKLEPTSWLSKLLLGISEELARIDARGEDLLDEWDPRTATETLEDWERLLSITPAAGAALTDRRVAVAAAYAAQGGATPAYFEALAASLGIAATVVETADPSVWQLVVDVSESSAPWAVVTTYFRVGTSRVPDRLGDVTMAEFEEIINRAKPAHTRCLFVYA